MYMCVGCGCSFSWIYVFSTCLRAPRKIDSSIGLPSLNKVVTYLLTYEFLRLCYKHEARQFSRFVRLFSCNKGVPESDRNGVINKK